jgi:hypothetical protein
VSEPSKEQLTEDAEAIGVDPEGLTKPQLKDAIAARQTPELGPPAPEGGEAPAFEQVGSVTGVQPLEADQIPESGR